MSTAVASHAHPPTSTGLDHRKIAIWAFIGSECMLFASLISTYLIYKGRNVVGPFPHEACNPPICATHLNPILNIPVTSFSTFVLLMSSLAMVLALAAVENRGKPGYEGLLGSSKFWLAMTAVLGTTFLGCQAYEFTSFVHEGLTIRTNLFGSSFFTLTGFHGAHVTAGVLWLLTMMAQVVAKGFRADIQRRILCFALFWHALDIIWVAVFSVVYLLGSAA